MNDATQRAGAELNDAHADLSRLQAQVSTMRTVLVQLLQDVVRADSRLDQDQAEQLLEANERLVVSAMGALTEAETAHDALGDATRMASLDALTRLPNRTRLMDRFESAISNAKRYGNRVAVLFLDLDGFKEINDTRGHATGDDVLQWVAGCLTSLVRETDTVSRHGGDEFLILLADVAHADYAAVVAEKVNATLAAPWPGHDHGIRLTASIGISVYPEDGREAKTLIDRADAAMYLGKKRRPGGFVFHAQSAALSSVPSAVVAAAAPAHSLRQRVSPHEWTLADHERMHQQLREANEQLVLAALDAQELLAAAEESKARQAEMLGIMAAELSDPFSPIRLAASTIGLPGADATLLPRMQALIEQQVDKMSRMVCALLGSSDGQRNQTEADRGPTPR